ncbi:MAG: FecCD family ABC transporter permease [Planctomycetota bacterium]
MPASPRRLRRPGRLGVLLAALLPVLLVLSVRFGSTSAIADYATVARACLGALHLAPALADSGLQHIVELRLWRALTAAGVGAALGLSGALVQGLFRNPLASPSVLGITGGASLGAVLAVMWLGGFGARTGMLAERADMGLLIVPLSAFLGALVVGAFVWALASSTGRVSIPALLLVGIAMNTITGGIQQLLQVLVIGDWEVSRSILAWTFGSLDDRTGWHALVVWLGVFVASLAVPWLAWELDLMQAGLEDAQALGVHTGRVRLLALCAASIAAATAVAVAGQIAFVGLVVPHVVRFFSGSSHRVVLPLSALAGAVFLVGTDVAQRALLRDVALQPGVVMSLLGGPFFLILLWRKRREIELW